MIPDSPVLLEKDCLCPTRNYAGEFSSAISSNLQLFTVIKLHSGTICLLQVLQHTCITSDVVRGSRVEQPSLAKNLLIIDRECTRLSSILLLAPAICFRVAFLPTVLALLLWLA
jgi:hypothetical protein